MSVLTVTVAGTDIDYRDVELTRGISPARPTPEATVRRVPSVVETGDSITISEGGTTLFTGQVARPKVKSGGSRDLTCEHALAPLFEESVDVPPTTSVQSALSSALSNASTSATLSFVGGDVTLGDDYQATDRSVKRIFRDLTERTGRVWRIEDPDTVVVEPLGAGPTIQINTTADAAVVDSYDPGDVRTVVNDVTVNGTGGERVTGTDSDATSINDYGTRSETTNVEYIRTESEADDYASELLVPEPLAAADVRVGATVTDIVSDRTNAVIDLTDPSRDIAGVQLVIEEQTNTSGGSAVFSAGEGAATDLVERNRQAKSDEDTTEPGSVYNTDRIADDAINSDKLGPDSVTVSELADDAVTSDKIFPQAVVEGALADDAVARAKVQTSAINAARLADSAVETAKIAQAAINGDKIQTGAVGASKLFIADWIPIGLSFTDDNPGTGDVSWNSHQLVYDGQTYDISAGSTSATYIYWFEGDGFYQSSNFKPSLGPDDALVCINDDGSANQILQATSIHGGSIVTNTVDTAELRAGAITADEIDANAITADKIDVLDLDTDQLTISDPDDPNTGIEFQMDNSILRVLPNAQVAFGNQTTPFSFMAATTAQFNTIVPTQGDNSGFVGQEGNAFIEMVAYDFIDASSGSSITDGGDPLAGLADGHGPPDTCEVCDDDGERKGYSINQMARDAWDVIRAQQRRIDDLETRLAALEGDTDPNA